MNMHHGATNPTPARNEALQKYEEDFKTVKEVALLMKIHPQTVRMHTYFADCPVWRPTGLRRILINFPRYKAWVDAGGPARANLHKTKAQKRVRKEAETDV